MLKLIPSIIETHCLCESRKITIKIAPIRADLTAKLRDITHLFNTKYRKKFSDNKLKESVPSIYEEAVGFNITTRVGSKAFCNVFGDFFQNFCAISDHYKRSKVLVDGESVDSLYECKSRFNTMKASEAAAEIRPKLRRAIESEKYFYLLVLTDKDRISRNIPLHQAPGLNSLRDIEGYDESLHRWVSGDEVWTNTSSRSYTKIT